jgi:probable HAF family extracellular repeat protein
MKRLADFATLAAVGVLVACSDLARPVAPHWSPPSSANRDFVITGATDLGTLGGRSGSAFGLNDLGEIVGMSAIGNFSEDPHPFLWTSQSGMGDLGTFGGAFGQAKGINDMGQVVGVVSSPDNAEHAFLWTPSAPGGTTGEMVDIGGLPGGGSQTIALGINGLGQIVGIDMVAGVGHAYVWTPERPGAPVGAVTDISGGLASSANAINDIGQVAGTAQFQTGSAFLWSARSGMVSLGTLPGATSSEAFGINNAGQVVGAAYDGFGRDHPRAFVWTPSSAGATTGILADLSAVVGFPSTATGINDIGQVVGYGLDASGIYGFIWSERDGVIRIPSATLWAINAAGQAVGVLSDPPGTSRAFRWSFRTVPPDPVTEVQNIASQVQALLTSGALNKGQGNALLSKLNAITAKLNQSNTTAAINILLAFINQCHAYMSAGILTLQEGQPLIDAATALIQQLSGGA